MTAEEDDLIGLVGSATVLTTVSTLDAWPTVVEHLTIHATSPNCILVTGSLQECLRGCGG
jgi:hypothetical protein